jgi:hypothetical protein
VTYNLMKTYRSFTSPVPEPGLSCAYGPPIPRPLPHLPLLLTSPSPSGDLSTIVPSLRVHQYLHSRAGLLQVADREPGEVEGLPPSYSLLGLDKELPTYAQATQ